MMEIVIKINEDEDIKGLSSEQISEKFKDYELSDDVFWTQWY